VLGRLLVPLGAGLWLGALMTMLGVHSLSVLGAILLGALATWLVWLGFDRRWPDSRAAERARKA
jgi:membrane-associated phospholipid phosphatase